MSAVLIEGYTLEQLLELPDSLLAVYVFTGEPLVFRAGSAEVLGSCKIMDRRLMIELAQIEGGGEGVLLLLWTLANRYAKEHQLEGVEWIVHAVTCAKPNLKLRRVLARRGFIVKYIEGPGECYHLMYQVSYGRFQGEG